MNLDLREELDRSFGDGPAHPPVQQRIAAGRRALVRRRVGAAAAALGVVVVAGAVWAAVPDDPTARRTDVATDPSPSPTPTAEAPWQHGETVRYRGRTLEVRPGVVVHEHLENPYGYAPPKMSDALDLTFRGQRSWVILDGGPGPDGRSSSVPLEEHATFADYVDAQVGAEAEGWPDTLRLTDEGAVVATEGSEVLQRTDDPGLGVGFAPRGAATGAAVVRAGEDGVDYFVVWRVVDGELDVVTTAPRHVVGATWEELLSSARGRYGSGGGQ